MSWISQRFSQLGARHALLGSLVLNLLLIGILVGDALHDRRRPPPRDGIPALVRALPETHRKALFARFRGAREGRDHRHFETPPPHEVRAQLAKLARAEPFDRGAFIAALKQMQGIEETRRAQGAAHFADQIAAMDAAEREAFADRLERKGKRGHR